MFLTALQIYSVRDDATVDLYGTLKKVREMGYDGVEFAGLYGYPPLEVKAMCEEIGLVPISAHVPLFDMVEDSNLLNDYKQIGCEYVAIPSLPMEYRPGQEKFSDALVTMNTLGEKAKEAGIKLCYHNHDFEFVKVNGVYGFDVLYEQVPTLMAEIDSCWVRVAGEKPEEYIRKYAGREEILHLKDYVGDKSENMYELIGVDEGEGKTNGPFEFRPVGYGVQDFSVILEAAKDVGIKWLIVEQDRPAMGKTPLECAEMSLEYLKTAISKMN